MRTWLATFLFLASACNSVLGGMLALAEPQHHSTEGHIVGGGQEPSFVRHPEVIYAIRRGDLVKLTTDGATKETLLSCVRQARFSPTGREIAALSCNGIVILDVQTRTSRRLPTSGVEGPHSFRWGESGRAIQIEVMPQNQFVHTSSESRLLWLDARTGEAASPEPFGAYRWPSADCKSTFQLVQGVCGGLDRVDSGGQKRPLIRIEGCRQDGMIPPQGITGYFFSDDCRALVFNFDGGIFVADVETGNVSHLMFGELWSG